MDHLRHLLREMHRRSVWQVLGIYAAAAWAALEVTATLTETAGLPGWFPAFALALLVLGLPVVLATAVIQGAPPREKGEAGGKPAPGVARERRSASGVARLLTWRNAILGGAGALGLWGILATGLLLARGGDGGPAAEPAPGTTDRPSVAVLPLTRISGNDDDDYLADALHEEILTRLQQAGGLLVKSRTSVQRYRDTDMAIPDIAREMAADVVLEASVQRRGDRVRVTAQLIDGDTDNHLWAETFDRTVTEGELFSVQSDVALAIADALRTRLSPEEKARITRRATDDPEAQRLYLLGIYYWTRGLPGDMERSLDAYEGALERDPRFAEAWARKAETYMVMAHSGTPPWEAFPLGEEAATRALSLDPELAGAHAVLADVRYHYHWDWEGAEEGFRRAIELNPSHPTAWWWYAGLLSTLRRHDEALEAVGQGEELDPSATTYWFGARVRHWAGDLAGSLEDLRRGREVSPAHPWVNAQLGLELVLHGDSARRSDAYDILERVADMGPGPHQVRRAVALASGGREEAARRVLRGLERRAEDAYVPHYALASVHAALGDTARAMTALEASARDRDAALIWVNVEPEFAFLHDHPGFRSLVEDRMDLTLEPGGPLAARGRLDEVAVR